MNQSLHAVKRKKWILALTFVGLVSPSLAVPGRASEDAGEVAFVDIPMGGRPAALGGAYSALATDAYAVNLNPGGLGFLDASQLAGQHLSYLESSHYEYLSFAKPLGDRGPCTGRACAGSSLGGSVQYFGSGEIEGTDASGNETGDFSTRFSAYNLSFGRAVNKRLAFGVTGKLITARIADVSANAYAVDLGSMYKIDRNLTLATVFTNIGSKLTFLSEGDPLPAAFHLGLAYQRENRWTATAEGIFRRSGDASAHLGFEFQPIKMASMRISYRTDTAEKLGTLAGVSAGLGIRYNGMDVSYAWMPLADLGVTHHISFGLRFDGPAKTRGARK